jgi:predicted DNA-binding protein
MARKKTASPKRNRPLVAFTLSPEAAEHLALIAEATGRTKSAVVEALIRASVPQAWGGDPSLAIAPPKRKR